MLGKLKQMVFGLKKAAGVEAILTADGKMLFHLVVLSRNKNSLIVELKESGIDDINKLKSLIPANTAVSFTINGRGVLHKKIANGSDAENANLLTQVLPNAKESDFYLQKHLTKAAIFVSVIRKESLLKILEAFKSHNLPVVFSSTGPVMLEEILPFVKIKDDELIASGFSVQIKNNDIVDFKSIPVSSDTIVEIGEDKISSVLLSAYAAAFHLFIEDSGSQGLEVEPVKLEAEEFYNKHVFKIAGYAVLAFFLVLMLINYTLYNYYSTENGKLSGVSTAHAGLIKDIEELEKQAKEKESFLKRAGWLSLPKTSFYADQIGASIPSSIHLSEIRINPMNEKISKKEKKQIFRSDTIFISGSCSNATVLNPWMKELKNQKWVLKANNINYQHDHKTRSGNFEIELMVSDEF